MHTIIEELKAIRREKKLSQAEIAKKLFTPQSHLSSIEQGKVDPRLSTLSDMARLLGYELKLIPREMLAAIDSLLRGVSDNTPAWGPDESEDL